MSSTSQPLVPAQSRRFVAAGLLRSLVSTLVLIGVYYALPLNRLKGIHLGVVLTVGLLLLATATALQLRATLRAAHPGLRAVEALATTVPLFLLMFSAIYVVMSQAASNSFNTHALTRSDALYFTVTVFATVGFGDITATSQSARLLVTVQMLLDLLVLGLVVRVFYGAVQRARHDSATHDSGEQQPRTG